MAAKKKAGRVRVAAKAPEPLPRMSFEDLENALGRDDWEAQRRVMGDLLLRTSASDRSRPLERERDERVVRQMWALFVSRWTLGGVYGMTAWLDFIDACSHGSRDVNFLDSYQRSRLPDLAPAQREKQKALLVAAIKAWPLRSKHGPKASGLGAWDRVVLFLRAMGLELPKDRVAAKEKVRSVFREMRSSQ